MKSFEILFQVRSLESLMAEKEKQLLQSSNLLRQQLAQGQITNLDIKTSKREVRGNGSSVTTFFEPEMARRALGKIS